MLSLACMPCDPSHMRVQISAVWAVGLAEGASHVNWRKILTIVCWWLGSLIPVFLAAAALLAQGTLLCTFAREHCTSSISAILMQSVRLIERLLEGNYH